MKKEQQSKRVAYDILRPEDKHNSKTQDFKNMDSNYYRTLARRSGAAI